jgi:Putative Actinobacterial Holin-X, holin superfamily III
MTAPTSGTTGAPNPRPDVADASIGELIGDVTRDLSTLMRQELELARAELRQEAVKGGKAFGAMGAAGFAGYMVLLFLSIALWSALANIMDWSWSALIVAVIWSIAAAALYTTGRQQLHHVRPKPERTVETLKEVPDALRGREGNHHDR